MQIIVTNAETDLLNAISRPAEIEKRLPGYGKRMEFLEEYRKVTDDIGGYTAKNNKTGGGSGNLKIVARIPESLMITLMAIEPNFLKDKKIFWKWLDANPEYAAYSRKKPRRG